MKEAVHIDVSNNYKEHLAFLLNRDLDSLVQQIVNMNAEISNLEAEIAEREQIIAASKERLLRRKEEFSGIKAKARETRDVLDAINQGQYHWNDLVKNL